MTQWDAEAERMIYLYRREAPSMDGADVLIPRIAQALAAAHAQGRAEENERCAAIAEKRVRCHVNSDWCREAEAIGKLIRARAKE